MRVRLVVLAGVVAATAAFASGSAVADGRDVRGYGLSLGLPSGWVGHVLPGEIVAIAHSGAVVQVDEEFVSPERYVRLPQRVGSGTTRL